MTEYLVNVQFRPTICLAAILAASLLCAPFATAQASQADDSPIRKIQVRLAAADKARASGDPAQVDQASRKVIAAALQQLASIRAVQNQLPAAIQLSKLSLDLEDSVQTRQELAVAYAQTGQVDEALRETQTLLKRDPKSASTWALLGRLLSAKKDYANATAAFEKSLALKSDVEVIFSLATAYLGAHENEKAAALFRKCAQMTGNRASMHILVGRAYEAQHLNTEAEREYKAAIAQDAKGSRGHYFLGLFYLVKNSWEPTPEAKKELEEEVALNPKDFFGNYFLGYLASVEKKYSESDRYLQIAAAAKPDWPEPYLYMGLNAYGAGDESSAETYLRKAIELTGGDEPRNNYQVRRAYFTLGRILIRKGQREEGTNLIAKSREMENKLVANARQQALSSRELASDAPTGEPVAPSSSSAQPVADPAAPVAADVLAKLNLPEQQKLQMQSYEGQLRGILGNAYNDLGTSEARRKQYRKALENFQQAERWGGPDMPGLLKNLGTAAFLSGDYSEAARSLKAVVAATPSDQKSQAMLAMALFSTKDYAGAVEAFGKIQNTALSDPQMSYDWAAALARTNNRDQAGSVLQNLISRPISKEIFVSACQLFTEMQDAGAAQACFQKANSKYPGVQVPQ